MSFYLIRERLKLAGDRAKESNWHRHSNGGGWVENCSVVDASVYVGNLAIVHGEGTEISEGASVSGEGTVVCKGALVSGEGTVVSGGAWVVDKGTQVRDGAKVYGKGTSVGGGALVSGEGTVVNGGAWVVDKGTQVRDGAKVYGKGTSVCGGARINQQILVSSGVVADDRYFTPPAPSPRAETPSLAAQDLNVGPRQAVVAPTIGGKKMTVSGK